MTPKRKQPNLKTYTGRVAARIRFLREKAGITVEEFAKRVAEFSGEKVSVFTAYAWENGNSTPNIKMLPAIAYALQVKKARLILPDE